MTINRSRRHSIHTLYTCVLLNVVYTDAFHNLAQVLVAIYFLPVDFCATFIWIFFPATFLDRSTLSINLTAGFVALNILHLKLLHRRIFLSEYWISDKSYKFSVFLCSFCEPVPKNNQQEKQKDFSLLRYQLNVHVFINVYRQVLFFCPIATFLIFMKFYFCSRL